MNIRWSKPLSIAIATCLLIVVAAVLQSSVDAGETIRTANRVEILEEMHGYYPCSDCHVDQETNFQPRVMVDEHEIPLEWEDDFGETHFVEFGELLTVMDLLGEGELTGRRRRDLMRVGARIGIADYAEENGLEGDDEVWTLMHGGANLWCLDCHDAEDRDYLRKLNGERLSFNESHLLCGQCHGPTLADWEHGIHGRINGYWNAAMDLENESTRLLCVECHIPHAPSFRGMDPMRGPMSRIGNGKQSHEEPSHGNARGSHDDLGPHEWDGDANDKVDDSEDASKGHNG